MKNHSHNCTCFECKIAPLTNLLKKEHWHCANCNQGGFVGEGEPWHGPGSSLCPIKLESQTWHCASCKQVGTINSSKTEAKHGPGSCRAKLENGIKLSENLISMLAFKATDDIKDELNRLGHPYQTSNSHDLYADIFAILKTHFRG